MTENLLTALLRAKTNSKVVSVGEDVDLIMYHSLNAHNYSTKIRKYFWWKDNRKLNENGKIQEVLTSILSKNSLFNNFTYDKFKSIQLKKAS